MGRVSEWVKEGVHVVPEPEGVADGGVGEGETVSEPDFCSVGVGLQVAVTATLRVGEADLVVVQLWLGVGVALTVREVGL